MFLCKFARMYDNTIFTNYDIIPVAEDYFRVERNSFCVADGVTRDNIHGDAVPYPTSKEEVLAWIKNYPNPSGAYLAAKICGDTFVEEIEKTAKITKQEILKAIQKANKEIWEINKDRKIDYLKEDLYCCEAVGGRIVEDTLYCFSVGDCHISIYDEAYELLFTTINNHKIFEEYLDNVYQKENQFHWERPEDRVMVRRDYRNKPQNENSFGALSGEKEAEYYIDTYEVSLQKAKYICAYSDGCEPFFTTKESIKKLLNNPKSLQNSGKERTLIIYEKGIN